MDVENERAGWMWTISEERLQKKKILLFCIDDNVESWA